MKRILINPVPCIGCLSCEMVCTQKTTNCSDPRARCIRVELEPFTGQHVLTVCQQCSDPACATNCPVTAITQNPLTGAWEINRETCIRCGTCVASCPFAAMFWWDERHGPVKCDLCGGSPLCVTACHFGVIRYDEAEEDAECLEGIPAKDLDPLLGRGE